ncbi:hypothetical protein KDJ56_05250 [Brevibacillus composti]|uniref:Uncharacterized protein n=1 Tax=Brevibacillus composti TaxID=2796470 RepID=A0A7T5JPE4_9BACL|nr:S-layer homology domain-containing protein [Brevibacillus composti]QQE75388.1 hypothetical protein JD108_05570 [Brevibacillus composti]QUO42414.1 hypothetical protein KDJ56_05250 [Brevibacillus composti]
MKQINAKRFTALLATAAISTAALLPAQTAGAAGVFTDMNEAGAYQAAVQALVAQQVLAGYGADQIKPQQTEGRLPGAGHHVSGSAGRRLGRGGRRVGHLRINGEQQRVSPREGLFFLCFRRGFCYCREDVLIDSVDQQHGQRLEWWNHGFEAWLSYH